MPRPLFVIVLFEHYEFCHGDLFIYYKLRVKFINIYNKSKLFHLKTFLKN